MKRGNSCIPGLMLVLSILAAACRADEIPAAADASVYGQFVGSTPCDIIVRQQLGIAADADSNLIQWQLTLHHDPQTQAPAGYRLRCTYGATVQGTPGLAGAKSTVESSGSWKLTRGTKTAPAVVVYELSGSVALVKVGHDLLHVLHPDRSLMVGNGGWSYTLNRLASAEKPGDRDLALAAPSVSYRISPLATGPKVLGVFEGRTPALGIARQLKLPENRASIKAKWRVTLYQDPQTLEPTTYKVEGSLYREGAREGKWTIDRGGADNERAVVYRLEPTRAGEPPILLLQADDNVLFFLDTRGKPLVGHADFGYTLNRRATAAEPTTSRGH